MNARRRAALAFCMGLLASLVPATGARSGAESRTLIWADSFESGDFRAWSFVQGADPKQGGPGPPHNFVATAVSLGIPAHDGKYVAQFERPVWATALPHAKVYKEWSNAGLRDQFGRLLTPLPDNNNPSASYSAWYYLPPTYRASAEWSNIFQFKEEGYIGGVWHQDPDWWINIGPVSTWGAGGAEPVVFANHWKQNYDKFHPVVRPAPLGRWFEIRAELYEHDRIDWYLDGRKFDTSYDSTYPVGRFFDRSTGWIFGVGHYLGYGKLWVDDARVTGLGSAPQR